MKNGNDFVVKTAAGHDELKSRAHKLSQRVRALLIMIDGSQTVDQLQLAANAIGNVPADFLQDLERQGLIAIRPASGAQMQATPAPRTTALSEAERFRMAQKLMNDMVVDALGFRAFFFTLKLEKCLTTADLAGLVPEYEKAVAKGAGAEAARVMTGRLRDLLR